VLSLAAGDIDDPEQLVEEMALVDEGWVFGTGGFDPRPGSLGPGGVKGHRDDLQTVVV
jgi:hypothetical protein